MKLLICTQAVDTNDPVLGFFHRWIEELAKHFERITVVCLRKGSVDLQHNVEVIALGERGKILRALEVLTISWGRRAEYDAVFVHMNQEYVLAAGWLWRLMGKRIYLWRNHWAGDALTDFAARLCTKVFYTSKQSYTAKFGNAVQMPVGIDTDTFVPSGERIPHSILSLGRIAPSKRLEILLDALAILKKRGEVFTCDIYGDPRPEDRPYYDSLLNRVRELHITQEVMFHAGVPNNETPPIYSRHEIFVNTSRGGMFDKTMLEAAACGAVVIAESPDFAELAGEKYAFTGTPENLAEKLRSLMHLPHGERQAEGERLRSLVARSHSLVATRDALVREINA